MATPDPGPRVQLDMSSRSMPPIEEPNPASVPAPRCRAQRSGAPWDQRGGPWEGPRAQAFLCLPRWTSAPHWIGTGLVNETPEASHSCPPASPPQVYQCKEPPNIWPLSVSPIQSNFVLFCFVCYGCIVLLTKGLTLQSWLVWNMCIYVGLQC